MEQIPKGTGEKTATRADTEKGTSAVSAIIGQGLEE
jgi:hypothetical protein